MSSCNWVEDSKEPKKKPWLETSREVYEQQLQQLENAMFEKMAKPLTTVQTAAAEHVGAFREYHV